MVVSGPQEVPHIASLHRDRAAVMWYGRFSLHSRNEVNLRVDSSSAVG